MFQFSEVSYDVGEAGINAEVCIDQVTGVTSNGITVTITTGDGSAMCKYMHKSLDAILFPQSVHRMQGFIQDFSSVGEIVASGNMLKVGVCPLRKIFMTSETASGGF